MRGRSTAARIFERSFFSSRRESIPFPPPLFSASEWSMGWLRVCSDTIFANTLTVYSILWIFGRYPREESLERKKRGKKRKKVDGRGMRVGNRIYFIDGRCLFRFSFRFLADRERFKYSTAPAILQKWLVISCISLFTFCQLGRLRLH